MCGRAGLAVLTFRAGRPVLVDFKCPRGCTATASDLALSDLAELLPEIRR